MHVPKIFLAAMLIIGVGLVLYLNRLDDTLSTAKVEVIANRIVGCRLMAHEGLDIQPGGPCSDPEILAVTCKTPEAPRECDG